MKPLISGLGILILILSLATCSAGGATNATPLTSTTATAAVTATVTASTPAAPAPSASILAALQTPAAEDASAWQGEDAVPIALAGATITADGAGVTVDGNTATITAAGSYRLSGTLDDGQIVVDSADAEPVRLILDGATLRNRTGAPILVRKAAAVVVILADGTQNVVEDGAVYTFADPAEDEPNAAIFSKADLTVAGNGALVVNGNYNDGIASKDGLLLNATSITVTAVDDAIRGKDYLVIEGGAITATAGGDGLKSDNEEDASLGYLLVEGGTLAVTAGGDAITAQSQVLVQEGTFDLVAGGGSTAVIDASLSAKGIKSATGVHIDGGTFTIDAADDAIHANDSVVIAGGVFDITTGDDGIHADKTLTIEDGAITIARSYEGIESAVITINGGALRIAASDDGINVAGGNDGSGMMRGGMPGGPRPGQEVFSYDGDYYLYVNGGDIYVNATGDGVDVNGAAVMTGGTLVVDGPSENMNAALDYDAIFTLSGGTLVAAGSAGMAQAPGSTSTQAVLLLNLDAVQPAGTLIHIQDSQGRDVLTFATARSYQSLAFSSPLLVAGETYTVYVGGASSGAVTNGLYAGGAYTPGAEVTSFTVESIVTQIGARSR